MGKDRIIKRIAKLIAGKTAHKILVKHTNRPESIPHMDYEIDNYRGLLSKNDEKYNWNIYDKQRIILESKKALPRELRKKHFEDVRYPESEKTSMLNETINEFFN